MGDYERIEKVIHCIDRHYRQQPSLSELAQAAGLSESHFHRLFTSWAGITPKAFVKCLTAEHAKHCLKRSSSVLEAALDAGLSGPGRLHDLLISVEGVTPGEYKSKGQNLEIGYGFHSTVFGLCLIGMTNRGICHLAFVEDEKKEIKELQSLWPKAILRKEEIATRIEIEKIFKPGHKRPKIKLHLQGTSFQIKVWKALIQIPEGQVVSYGEIAKKIGLPRSSRAVGTAIGSNKIGYLIPCHRVIRNTGVFGEYRWGSARKKAILAREIGRALSDE